MQNLIALSLGLPGTPLHGLSDFESRSRSATAPLHTVPGPHQIGAAGARRRRPQPTRGRRFALRIRRPAPARADLGA